MQWRAICPHGNSNISWTIRRFAASKATAGLKPVKILDSWDITAFRSSTNNFEDPVVLPWNEDQLLSASSQWFQDANDADKCSLRPAYLDHFGDCLVPLEMTTAVAAGHVEFRRTHAPLSFFLRWTREARIDVNQRIYLAQCQLLDLPEKLRSDLPTPTIVQGAGKGDIYDANIWMGRAPTYTPLHRDPNPNLFYQLAGKKVVRMFPPSVGDQIFRQVRAKLGNHGGSASMRGEEMMAGAERTALEERVWTETEDRLEADGCQEVTLEYGQALFIPLRWWHSIKGLGTGVTGSVNWWFR